MEGTTISGQRGMSSKNRTMYKAITTYLMISLYPHAFKEVLNQVVRIRAPRRLPVLAISLLLVLPFCSIAFLSNPLLNETTTSSTSLIMAAEPPKLTLTWYTLNNETQVPVSSGDKISGDHIILNAVWLPADNVNGTEIIVNAPAIPSVIKATSPNNSVSIDTRALGNNATCTLNVTTWLLNGTALSEIYTNIVLGNFFIPSVQVLTPNGGEVWTGSNNITWVAEDRNIAEELTFEVHISADGGSTYQLISSGLTNEWLWIDFSSFQNLSTYRIEVRVFDGIYEAFDESDGTFTAGTVNITPPSSTTNTTPTDVGPSEESVLAYFIAAAIVASAILSVIVYYQAKRLP